MKVADLIQRCDGVEIPANGDWLIAPGQKLDAPKRRHHGLDERCLHTTSGKLAVSTNPRCVTFELGLSSALACTARTFAYVGELAAADRYGRWRLSGTVATDGTFWSPLDLAVLYQGVFRHGATAIAWLTLAWPTSRESLPWRRHRRPLMLHGDLNAHQAPTMEQLAALWGPREDPANRNVRPDRPPIEAAMRVPIGPAGR